MEIAERALLVYSGLKEILERMDITVDKPKLATNQRKLGNIGIRCTTSSSEDEAWIIIRRNYDILEIVPPLYKFKEKMYYTNDSDNEDLCGILNRVVREYVTDNKKLLLNDNYELMIDMGDLLRQYNIISRECCKFDNIKILRGSFYKNYIELEILCRNKNSLNNESDWGVDFCVPIIITKSETVVDRRSEYWASNNFTNNEDIYILINKKSLRPFNRVLKDTVFKNIYKYVTRTNLESLISNESKAI